MDRWHEAWKTHPGLPGALLCPGSSEHGDAALWAHSGRLQSVGLTMKYLLDS